MKTKLLLLISVFSSKKTVMNDKSVRERFLTIAEELGAWMLFGGFVMGIYEVAEILLRGQVH